MRRSSLGWGIVLLLVGLLLLLSNLDVVTLDVWSAVASVALIGLGVAMLWSVLAGEEAVAGEEMAIPLAGAFAARVQLRHGAGRLRVNGGASPGMLLEGSFRGGLDYRTQRRDDELLVEVFPRGLPFVLAPWNWGRDGLRWSFTLNDQISLSLSLETGASDVRLDLTTLSVRELRLSTGASSVSIKLPASAGQTDVRVEAGAASVSLEVPADVAARVHTEGILASVDIDQTRFPQADRVYQSPGYHAADNKVDIKVEAGIGSLAVY